MTKFVHKGAVYVLAFNTPPSGFLEGSLFKGTLYHGSDTAGLTTLKPDIGGEYGIYLTPKHKYARLYGSSLYRVLVNIQSPFFVSDKSEISPKDLTEEDIESLRYSGYDSIVSGSGTSVEDSDEVVVFDSNQVHIL